jgi:hypothetical protein
MVAKRTRKTYRKIETGIGRIYGTLLLLYLNAITHLSDCGQYDCGFSHQETSK